MKKNLKRRIFNVMKFMFTFGVVFGSLTVIGFAGAMTTATKLFTKASIFLDEIANGLLYVSMGAAVVAIATGVLMKKFSMGKQDKIETGNRIIRETIIALMVVNAAPWIVKWVAATAR
jgi:hypothetical protein